MKLYEGYDDLYMQLSKKCKFNYNPDWYYGIEYTKEKTRGYDYREDLFSPGNFEVPIKKGESVIFAAGLTDIGNSKLNMVFDREKRNRIPRNNFVNCLENAAEQFIMRRGEEADLIAGYHWFTVHGRDTFIALPGLTLPKDNTNTFFSVINSMVKQMQGIFFPSLIHGNIREYKSVDTQLWFIWSLQQYVIFSGDAEKVWQDYSTLIRKILTAYKEGTEFNIFMQENGLLYSGHDNDTLTWMNTRIKDEPVINRNGLAVEVNALWYNAIRFFTELAEKNNKTRGINEWRTIAEQIEIAFTDTFWSEEEGYLADVVKGDYKDMAVRPNQLFAASLPYSPITEDLKYLVVHKVQQELLTPRGIRTLSPKNPDYIGIYKGDIVSRDRAYHRGSAFPWLLGHFGEAYLRLHGLSGIHYIKRFFEEFEEEMTETGIGTISELFYGDPPQKGKGGISHAWSVAELLRLNYIINQVENNTDQNE
jgi:predicted glycogen debranching enzyme